MITVGHRPSTVGYEAWRDERAAARAASRAARHATARPWNHLISIVVDAAARRPDRAALADTLQSISRQSYRNVEVLLLGSGGYRPRDPAELTTMRGLFVEPQLSVIDLLVDPAAASAWRGSHLAVIEPGTTFDADAFELLNDLLSPWRGGDAPDLIVVDHDRRRTRDEPAHPCFLPGWDPDLLDAVDYLGGSCLVARRLVESRRPATPPDSWGSWLVGLGGDRAPLRVAHLHEPVVHLLADPPARRPDRASAPTTSVRGTARRSIAVVIPNRDQPELLGRCIAGLDVLGRPEVELVVVDHDSTDPDTLALYGALVERYGARVERVRGRFNFSRMVNAGVAATTADVVLLVNNDIECTEPGQLDELVAHASRPDVGVAGAHLVYPDGRLQHAGMLLRPGPDAGRHPIAAEHVLRGAPAGSEGYLGNLTAVCNYQAVTGALLATRREAFEHLGGFDEVNLPVEYNDVDYCLRAREAGWRVVAVPTRGVVHRESSTRGTAMTPEVAEMRRAAMTLLVERWPDAFRRDPFHNPWVRLGEVPSPRFAWSTEAVAR